MVKRARRGRRRLLTAAALAGVAAGVLLALPRLSDWASGFFFYPSQHFEGGPAEAGVATEELRVVAPDGTLLHASWLRTECEAGPAAVVLHAHGNAGNLSHHWELSAGLLDRGLDVVVFDYRGFGRSPGTVSRRRAVEDVSAVLDHVVVLAAARGLPVAVLGQSMGAALAVEALSGRHDVVALALDSPFASWAGIASWHVARGRWHEAVTARALRLLFAAGGADPIDLVGGLSAPLLVVTGEDDQVCPARMGRELASAAHGAQLLVLPAAPHVGLRDEDAHARALDAVADFVRAATGRTP